MKKVHKCYQCGAKAELVNTQYYDERYTVPKLVKRDGDVRVKHKKDCIWRSRAATFDSFHLIDGEYFLHNYKKWMNK